MFFSLYKRANDAVLTNFRRFPKISDHFPKISEDFLKLFRKPDERFQTFSEHFRRFSEDYRRLPKIAEDDRRRSEYVSIILRQIQPIQQKQKPAIMTSLNDTTLAKVTYGKYPTQVPDQEAYLRVV